MQVPRGLSDIAMSLQETMSSLPVKECQGTLPKQRMTPRLMENGRWQQRATMQRVARSASRPGGQPGRPGKLPSKLPKGSRLTQQHTTWQGRQTAATQTTGRQMVIFLT